MSLRPLLAGPSARPVQKHLRTFARHLTIPHPDVAPTKGTSTSFRIKTVLRLPSLAHVYAVVRAAEKALGSSIIAVDVKRDQDTLQAYSFIEVQTLHPVAHDKTVHLSVAAPKVESDIFGGPSLDEVRSALRNEPRDPVGEEEELAFKIELNPRSSQSNSRYSKGERVRLTRGTPSTVAVLDALEDLGGKWGEIADKYAYLRGEGRSAARRTSSGEKHASGQHVGGLDGDKTQVDGVEQAEARAERRESKHRRHDSDERRNKRDDEDDTIERSRQRSEHARELRHRQRAAEVASREEKERESDWKFDLDEAPTGKETDVNLDALKLRPEPPATAPDSETGAASLSDLQSAPRPRGFSVRQKISPIRAEPTAAPSSSPAAAQIPDSAPASARPKITPTQSAERKKPAVAASATAKPAATQRVLEQMRRDAQAREARRAAEAERAARARKELEERDLAAREEVSKKAEEGSMAQAGSVVQVETPADGEDKAAAYEREVAQRKRDSAAWTKVDQGRAKVEQSKSWWPFGKS